MPRKSSIRQIFDHCFAAIGGQNHDDVYRYLYERPKVISREVFFDRAVWAIWVGGLSRKSARTFLDRAEEAGLPFEFNVAGSWGEERQSDFMVELHGYPIPRRAKQKWMATFQIAKMLKDLSSENSFRDKYFGGKSVSAQLGKTDILQLQQLKLPFIGPANAHYIVRGMGGEAIKCDRWIRAFLDWYPMTLDRLESKLRDLSIPLGMFDLVVWCYCEMFVHRVEYFRDHFDREFP